MPHLRKRYTAEQVKALLTFSPLVGILGHRQVGKTTLASQLIESYFSLDLRTTYESIAADPLGFLNSLKKQPSVLDECQTLPELFPALKEYVRTNQRPGSFLLTGSVRFTSRKAIRESLTGRIIYSELLPMDMAEIHGIPLSNSLSLVAKDIKNILKFKRSRTFKKNFLSDYLSKGGLPGIFSIRDESVRIQKLATQLETILDRDLRLIMASTLTFPTLKNVLAFIAQHQGENLNLSLLQRSTRVSRPTLQKLLLAFEALFLIRPIRCEGDLGSRVYFLEDQAEASYLVGSRTDPSHDLLRFLYANLRLQLIYRPALKGTLFRYETRGGALVPLAFRFEGGEIGIIPILEQNPNRGAISSANSFLKKYNHSKVIFVNSGGEPQVLSPRLCVIPAGYLIS